VTFEPKAAYTLPISRPREHLARRDFQGARGVAQPGDDLGELLRDTVDVVLQSPERPLVLAGHALRKVGLGQRRKDGGGFAQAVVHCLDQVVDAVREAVEFRI
jgi:hypothetical protein